MNNGSFGLCFQCGAIAARSTYIPLQCKVTVRSRLVPMRVHLSDALCCTAASVAYDNFLQFGAACLNFWNTVKLQMSCFAFST